jgi:dihydroflavonol-4-reductase
MKAFITGASGFIGAHLVEELLRQKWQVRVLLHKRRLPNLENLQVFHGDIRDPSNLKDMFKDTDILFHMAASLGGSRISKKDFYEINVDGTRNVLKAAQDAGVGRIVHFSSAGVFGSVRENRPVEEAYLPSPLDVYDKTKLEGEKTALAAAKQGGDVVVIRPGWVYGPGDRRTFKLIKAIASKRFFLVTKGTTCQTPVYIDDLIQGIMLCTDKAESGEIYHLAGKEVLTVKEIMDIIAHAAGVRYIQFPLPTFALKVAAWKLEKAFLLLGREAPLTRGKLAFFIHPKPLSIEKAKKELGYVSQWDFKTGVEAAIAWYRKNGWLKNSGVNPTV